MKFRPCIDIHNGQVKQIVGGSLQDESGSTVENFVSGQDAAYYARMYQRDGLSGGHIVLLNPRSSVQYQKNLEQAREALAVYPGGLQIGGGVSDENAAYFLNLGASHVIVTSYVFQNGRIQYDNLKKLAALIGKKHLVLDLSCKKQKDGYYVMTDRWQRFTTEKVTIEMLDCLSGFCDEFLIHAVDVEGKALGIEQDLVRFLGSWKGIPITYAGGVGSFSDLEALRDLGQHRLDVTIGSALSLFGGPMDYSKVLGYCGHI